MFTSDLRRLLKAARKSTPNQSSRPKQFQRAWCKEHRQTLYRLYDTVTLYTAIGRLAQPGLFLIQRKLGDGTLTEAIPARYDQPFVACIEGDTLAAWLKVNPCEDVLTLTVKPYAGYLEVSCGRDRARFSLFPDVQIEWR